MMKDKQKALIEDTELSLRSISKYLQVDYEKVRQWKYGRSMMPGEVTKILKGLVRRKNKIRKNRLKIHGGTT